MSDSEELYRANLNNLRDKNNKEECVILSCGPSLNLFSEEQIRDFCKNKFVIAIKFAYLKYGDITDVAMANACNLPYSESGVYFDYSNTFSILSCNLPKNVLLDKQPCDLFIKVSNPFEKPLVKDSFTCFTLDFESNTLDKTLNVQCYPGIIGESAIPFVQFMKFKKLYTIGWDLVNGLVNINNYQHFWDEGKPKLSNPGNPGALPWDNIANIEASGPLNQWLKSHGMTWNIIGNSCLSDEIPRIVI